MDDAALRHAIYQHFADKGEAPTVAALAAEHPGVDVAAALARLHEAHAVVLDTGGEIRMALPFSAVPTPHVVRSGERRWWANCAWDSMAIPAALDIDVTITSEWMDADGPVTLTVRSGELSPLEGHVHFAIPACRWWDHIVETCLRCGPHHQTRRQLGVTQRGGSVRLPPQAGDQVGLVTDQTLFPATCPTGQDHPGNHGGGDEEPGGRGADEIAGGHHRLMTASMARATSRAAATTVSSLRR